MGASLEEWKGPGWLDCALRNSVALSGSRSHLQARGGNEGSREREGNARPS